MFKIELFALTLLALNCMIIYAKPGRPERNHTWDSFKTERGRNFKNKTEEIVRQKIWQSNYEKIKKHNQEADQNLHSYFVNVNEFTDLTEDEFQNKWLGLKVVKNKKRNHNNNNNKTDDSEENYNNNGDQVQWGNRRTVTTTRKTTSKTFTTSQPTSTNKQVVSNSKDWRLLNGVTPVKNQLSCGSCWAFASVATIESQYLIKKNSNINLSEQNLVDCSTVNSGCNGGWPDYAFDYVVARKGLAYSISYPYRALDQACKSSTNIGGSISSYFSGRNNEAGMVKALDTVGPIVVTLNANTLQYYAGGIINEPSCSKSINHAVTAVGFGTENGIDYYICKNSWGPLWGENGYFRIARNKNMCGIATYYGYPIL